MDLWALDPGPAPVFWRERLGAGVRQLRSRLAPHVPAGCESIARAQHALVAHRDNVLAGVVEFREQGAQACLHVARAFAPGRPAVDAAGFVGVPAGARNTGVTGKSSSAPWLFGCAPSI